MGSREKDELMQRKRPCRRRTRAPAALYAYACVSSRVRSRAAHSCFPPRLDSNGAGLEQLQQITAETDQLTLQLKRRAP